MVDGPYFIGFALGKKGDGLVRDVIDECSTAGFFETPESTAYHHASSVAEIADTGHGLVRLQYNGGFKHKLIFDLDSPDWEGMGGLFRFTMEAGYLDPDSGDSAATHAFRDALIDLVGQLAVRIEPAYVNSVGTQTATNEFHRGIVPQNPLNADQFDHVPWLGVYAPETVDGFGGVNRVLSTPACRVEQLDSGHVLMIATESPWSVPDREVEAHLL